MGTLRWKKVYVEAIPVPSASSAKRQSIGQLVDRMISAKTMASDASTDITVDEAEIDRRVCELYGLSQLEIDRLLG